MKSALIILITFQFQVLLGQNFDPKVAIIGKNVEDFIPNGWLLKNKVSGDLNKDNKSDFALVIQKNDQKNILAKNGLGYGTINANPRILIIVFNDSIDGNFRLICQNNTFILRHDEPTMDDPFQDISIINGVLNIDFRIFYNAGSWSVTTANYKFRFQKDRFLLIGADKNSLMRNSGDSENYSINFLTKKMSTAIGNEFDESIKPQTTWKKIKLNDMPTFDTFKEPFTLEVDKYVII